MRCRLECVSFLCRHKFDFIMSEGLADLSLNALLGDEGLQRSGLRVLGVAKVQDLCTSKHKQITVSKR